MHKETKIGILATISAAILYLGLSFLKGNNFMSRENIYYTYYNDTNGLKPSSPVLYKGVNVGRVISLAIVNKEDNTPKVKITFSVQKDIKLTKTTQVQSGNEILGFKGGFINLLITPGEPLPPHSTVEGIIDIGIADRITPTIRSIDEFLYITNKFLIEIAKNTDKVAAIFQNLELITNKLGHIIANNEKNISQAAQEVAQILAAINDPQIGIKPILTTINSISKDLDSGFLKANLFKIQDIISSLDKIIKNIETSQGTLGKLVHDQELYDNLNKTLKSTESLLIDIQNNPWKYLHFSVFGRRKIDKS